MRSASSDLNTRPVSISSCDRAAPIEPRQQPRGADVARRQADLDERGRELRRLGGEAHIGAEHERESPAGGRAVDRGDDRLRERAQVRDQRGDVLLHGEAASASDRGARCAGAAPYPPRSSPEQNPRPAPVRITTRPTGSTAISSRSACSDSHHLRRHRVQRIGTVQRQLHHTGDVVRGRSTSDMAASLLMVLRCDDSWLVPSPGCLRSLCPHRCPRSVRSTPTTVVTSIAATLAPFRHGRIDPTTVLRSVGRGRTASGTFLHATLTPDGPGTVRVRWRAHGPNRQRWDVDSLRERRRVARRSHPADARQR